jgi:hypothetical protein
VVPRHRPCDTRSCLSRSRGLESEAALRHGKLAVEAFPPRFSSKSGFLASCAGSFTAWPDASSRSEAERTGGASSELLGDARGTCCSHIAGGSLSKCEKQHLVVYKKTLDTPSGVAEPFTNILGQIGPTNRSRRSPLSSIQKERCKFALTSRPCSCGRLGSGNFSSNHLCRCRFTTTTRYNRSGTRFRSGPCLL